jgi:hypothetical protein
MSGNRRTNIINIATPPHGTQERRSVYRYSVVQDNAWLGWWEGRAFQSTAAKIVDLSLRGALFTVDAFPPKDQPVWMCPPGIASNEEWIEVKVIGAKKRLFGPREVRVTFRKVFPYEIFKAVVYGPDILNAPVLQPPWMPEEAEERDWW